MSEAATKPLRSLCDPERAITYGIVQPGKLHDGGTPIVRVNNFRGHRLDLSERSYVSPEIEASYARSRPRPGDILISLVGSIGQVAIASPEILGWNLARAVGLLPMQDAHHSKWIFYALQTPDAQSFIQRHANTTVQATFNLRDLAEIPVPYPEEKRRKSALETLSALDDKIELNRRMNETLEALAQAIFRDWFVTFGPTRRKQEGATDPVAILGGLIPDPAKAAALAALFPDSFGADGLPVGWEENGLDEVAEFLNGLALQKYPPTGANDLPVIKIAELRSGITAKTDRANRTVAAKYLVKDGDFLFSWSGSLLAKFWTEGEGALNQHLFKVSSTTHPRWFYTQWVHHHMAEFQMIAASKATTMGHIQRGHLSAARVVVPPKPTLDAMTAIFEPFIERIIHNDLENRTLAETRDYLLPKLMSGAVRVRDAEKPAQEGGFANGASEIGTVVAFPTDLLGQPYLLPEQETERDAVMAASIVRAFRDGDTVVGNVKVQKGCYFIRRRAGISVQNFEKQAAGPYDQTLNHEGGRGEAIARNWIRRSSRATAGGKYIEGNVPDNKITEIDDLLSQYQLTGPVDWVVQHFASKTRDELECLATVDFAMRSLAERQMPISLETIKADIASDPVWKPKLAKPHFSNAKILEAIQILESLFGG